MPDADAAVPAEGGTKTIATLDTSKGKIVIELNPDKSPITVDNFKKYADDKFYDGLIFHRVIKDFMIQGGGLNENMQEQTATYEPIINEAKTSKLSNLKGTIAMARTSDPNSATSQFFINTVDNKFLDPGGSPQNPDGYAVFGMVVEGMEVVAAIESVPTGSKMGYDDVPIDPVLINSVVVEQK
ncbi:MAG: peptidylprolyl isomerase [Deltaproteobacteria bacterium]|nr:peptidylprolyl isomerase [Deltaproteobacteria bacterium]